MDNNIEHKLRVAFGLSFVFGLTTLAILYAVLN